VLVLVLTLGGSVGCVDEIAIEDGEGDEIIARELGQPAYFSVRKYDAYTWEIDVAGSPTSLVTCPGATTAGPVCFVPRLNLQGTGLTIGQQSHVLSRVATNGSEPTTAVVMGGSLVSVRDRRGGTTQTYVEFRATSVYLAPTVRPHGNLFVRAYVTNGQVFDGTRTFNLPIPVNVYWSYPTNETPPQLPLTDHIATATLISEVPDANGRFPASVTQVFTRYQ
jgi:hypothetical protein